MYWDLNLSPLIYAFSLILGILKNNFFQATFLLYLISVFVYKCYASIDGLLLKDFRIFYAEYYG